MAASSADNGYGVDVVVIPPGGALEVPGASNPGGEAGTAPEPVPAVGAPVGDGICPAAPSVGGAGAGLPC